VEDAGAIILTTCAFIEERADRTYDAVLDYVARRTNKAPTYIVGCFTRIEKEKMAELTKSHENVFAIEEAENIKEVFKGDNSWESAEYNSFESHPYYVKMKKGAASSRNWKGKMTTRAFSLVDFFLKKEISKYYAHRQMPYNLFSLDEKSSVWPVVASKGCTHNCSYCAVRIARGKFRSKPINSILEEIRTGVEKGYDRALLIGEGLGSYGVDFKDATSLSSLIESIDSENLPVQIGFWYVDCFMLPQAVSALERLAEKERLFFISTPLQSGSKRILDLMNRDYSLDKSLEILGRFRKYPKLIIATGFMVGFPTETEEDFLASVALAEKGHFDNATVYRYSPRPGTAAAKLEDNVPESVKRYRQKTLEEIVWREMRKRLLKHISHELKPQPRRLNV
jgi:tRNA A37 methylthiotransferase MiaB